MSRKNKALALGLLLATLGFAAGACSTTLGGNSEGRMVVAEDGETEEVLSADGDRDEFGRPAESSPEGGVGGVLVSLGYLGLMLGSALLPYLLFL